MHRHAIQNQPFAGPTAHVDFFSFNKLVKYKSQIKLNELRILTIHARLAIFSVQAALLLSVKL